MGRILSRAGDQSRRDEHTLSDKDFRYICKFVYDATGIVLDERKREMVYRRLMRRTRETRLPSFKEYLNFLNSNPEESPKFINAITTNLTSFFRENHHFEFLKSTVLPELLAQSQQRRLRIWSAGCSTGEEPYSIAITLKEAMGNRLNSWDAKILATDLDSDVVATGKAGIYKAERIDGLDTKMIKRWFKKNPQNGRVKTATELGELITFKQLNLLEPWPMKGPFDIIFCRNVVIYFDKPTQQSLFQHYYDMLKPGGYLIIGHSEGLGEMQEKFTAMGKTIFQKIDPLSGSLSNDS
ncbi:CheR family methyltransferase [Oceanicoccus sagamiensis]|uniref:Chemotaxis protein methyltransferase n=1 Tax=Oceanicoccus sagamiensis TaxID=716816 RepID=A0A1X9NA98_9GAMM|nr:protein-glutamate O-methyltransferase CheR [Oceanicoccus sagamiensis]ARN74980.1 chemotaxis protein CheR [Oceanicoccus sagamiensis]